MRQPLIDGDILLYEIGFAVETAWKGMGYETIPPFDMASEILDNRIRNVCALTEATEEPILYLTGKTNFRNEIAKTQKYKDRPSNKPFHYNNLKAYIKGKYDWRCTEGLEADDLMAIEQTSRPEETIICTRDKDLRQVEGWHYGWELGNQPSFGPELVKGDGYITLGKDKIKGVGKMFFLAQLLTGDGVDTVPGLGGRTGPAKAFKILQGAQTYTEGLKRVYEAYKGLHGHSGYARMIEQGRLLYMTRKLKADGTPLLWGQSCGF